MKRTLLTPKQVAQAIGVSESSIKRWCDAGSLAFELTAGGHRRLPIADVFQFVRQQGITLANPQLLSLPSNTGDGTLDIRRAEQNALGALIAGDEETVRRVLFDLYLAKVSVASICDQVVAKCFEKIGELWSEDKITIYQERLATTIILNVISELRQSIQSIPSPSAKHAVGAGLEGDHFTIPGSLVDVSLRDMGWKSTYLGVNLPFATIEKAINDLRPDVLWITCASIRNEQEFLTGLKTLRQATTRMNCEFVLGGRAIDRQKIFQASLADDVFVSIESFMTWLSKRS